MPLGLFGSLVGNFSCRYDFFALFFIFIFWRGCFVSIFWRCFKGRKRFFLFPRGLRLPRWTDSKNICGRSFFEGCESSAIYVAVLFGLVLVFLACLQRCNLMMYSAIDLGFDFVLLSLPNVIRLKKKSEHDDLIRLTP